MRLVVFDLVPALLSWEGRDPSEPPKLAEGADQILEILYSHYHLAAVTDSDRTATQIRDTLEDLHLGEYFDSIGTSADFGPHVTPRVIRRIAQTVRVQPAHLVVVTARPHLAEALGQARIAVIQVDRDHLDDLPERLRRSTDGRATP